MQIFLEHHVKDFDLSTNASVDEVLIHSTWRKTLRSSVTLVYGAVDRKLA